MKASEVSKEAAVLCELT